MRRTKKSATINSSLWGAIMEEHLPYALAAEMEDIYQWTVDFFGIQKGDNFTVIYDERFIDDSISAGIGRIWGAKILPGRQGVLRHPLPAGRQNPVLGIRRRKPAQADAQGAAEIHTHQFEVYLCAQASDLQRYTGRIRASITRRRKARPFMP